MAVRARRLSGLGYADAFPGIRDRLPGAGLGWLEEKRREALDAFAAIGLPTPRWEPFKFTNLIALDRTRFEPAEGGEATAETLAPLLLAEGKGPVLVFVGGRFDLSLSRLPEREGLEVTSLAAALESGADWLADAIGESAEKDSVIALNTAYMTDGAVIRVAPGARIEEPLQIVHLAGSHSGPVALPTRSVVQVGAGGALRILETFAGPDDAPYWTNAVTEVSVAEGGELGHIRVQREGSEALSLATLRASLGEGSRYRSLVLSLGGRLARNEIRASLDGEGASCELAGVTLAVARQHEDHTTLVDHQAPGCQSRQVYKGVFDDASHGVFQGKVTVRPGAQKTDAHQLNRNLLLSDEAQVDAKPELEINADDVKCSHGATAGELDGDAMFFLRSRGLDEAEARRLLVEAFVTEVLDGVEDAAVRDHLRAAAETRLASRGA